MFKYIFLIKNRNNLPLLQRIYDNKLFKMNKIFFSEENVYYENDFKDKNRIFDGIDVIFSTWYMPNLTYNEVAKYFPNLKHVFYAAGDTKYFESSFIKSRINVFSTIESNSNAVTSFVVGLILLANKGYFYSIRRYRGFFPYFKFNKIREKIGYYPGNYKTTIGIIGAGRIGKKIIKKLEEYKYNIVYYDPFVNLDKSYLATKTDDLDWLLKNCDVISNHISTSPESKTIFDYNDFIKMKKNCTFINTSRGNQINEFGLLLATFRRRDITFILDVTRYEPMRPWNILGLRKTVFLTPHIAGSQGNEYVSFAESIIDELYKLKLIEVKYESD